jgi:hypothetical protein
LLKFTYKLFMIEAFNEIPEEARQVAFPTDEASKTVVEQQIEQMGELDRLFDANGIEAWVWGGWAPDIARGEVIREDHGDIDYLFIENEGTAELLKGALADNEWELSEQSGAIIAHKGEVEAGGFIGVQREGDVIVWSPKDREGTITFPVEWLPGGKVSFGGQEFRAADIRLSYAMKVLPNRTNPKSSLRPKDEADIEILESLLLEMSENIPDYEPEYVLSRVNASPSVFGINEE